MELVLGLVCEEARVDAEGKLDVRGAFNDLWAPGFPAKQDRMVLVLVVEWDRGDHGRYKFSVDLVGPDGSPTLTVDGHSDVDDRGEDRPPARTRLLLPLEDVVFPRPGPYRLRMRVKGREMDIPALHLARSDIRPEPAGAPEPGAHGPGTAAGTA
jgi:hypothetical protein